MYPHLATGVLFNDETDAWHGYTLAWNIYFWHGDIASYWTRVRREMEQRGGDLAEDDAAEEDGAEERGRGKRKRRKLNVEKQHDVDAEGAEEDQDEEAQLAAATAASIAEHKQQVKPAASSAAAAAAAAAMSPAAAASGHKDAEERKTAETIEID